MLNFKKRLVKVYKGHKIVYGLTAFGLPYAYIDGDKTKVYSSLGIAQKVINGEKPLISCYHSGLARC